MLKLLKRWLGWDSDAGPFDFSDLKIGRRTPPATRPPPPSKPATAQPAQRKAPARKPTKERGPLDVLDNPRLTLDRPKDDGFDPYNTGAFNRSASWERIGRQKKR